MIFITRPIEWRPGWFVLEVWDYSAAAHVSAEYGTELDDPPYVLDSRREVAFRTVIKAAVEKFPGRF